MGFGETVRHSEMLLEHMSEEPEAVLKALNPKERAKVVANLHMLSRRAAGVRSEADLMFVANTIDRLIQGMPALAALLLPKQGDVSEKRRKVSLAQHQAMQRESQYARERAAQIRNRMVECQQKLTQALQDLPTMEE